MINWITHQRSASIRRQLIFGIALLYAVMTALFVFILVDRQRDFLQKQGVSQAISLTRTLAANSTSWVLANDFIGLEEVILSLTHQPGLRYAAVMDLDGKVMGHSDPDRVGQAVRDRPEHARGRLHGDDIAIYAQAAYDPGRST